jgi:hypothetical protein
MTHKQEAFWHQTYNFGYKINRAIKGLIVTRKVRVSKQDWRPIIKTEICWIIYYNDQLPEDRSTANSTSSIFMYLFIIYLTILSDTLRI